MTFKDFCLNPHKSCSQLDPSQVPFQKHVSFSRLAATQLVHPFHSESMKDPGKANF